MNIKHTRRSFIQSASALGLTGLMTPSVYSQGADRAAGLIRKRAIPGTSEMLPIVGFGSTAAVMQVLQDGPDLLTQLLDTMLGMGATVVDTAPREESIDAAFGQVLQIPRFSNGLFVTSKMGMRRWLPDRGVDKQGGMDQIALTRRLFNRHPADLVQVESMTDIDIHWSTLKNLKDRGDARYIGITTSATVDHERMEAFMRRERPDFIQVNFSLLEPEAEQRVLPLAQDMGMGVLINSPFNGGEFFRAIRGHDLPDWVEEFDCESWAQFNLKYILGVPAINTVLTETTRAVHLTDNIGAAFGRLPDAAMRRRIKAHFDSLG